MSYINVIEIERQARELRAKEMRRIGKLVSARLGVYAHLLATSAATALHAAGLALRSLFSWNPQAHHRP
ncbi:MAG: hypothetical protein Q8M11_07600 [Sulfuritalea sp.]|nr:hypothetical protein [Sulfuritalea sp.]MDP1982259.1 hypothetical protein [Sulfuritalea sp.]